MNEEPRTQQQWIGAGERGPYGRNSGSDPIIPSGGGSPGHARAERPATALQPYDGETYYQLPAVKASHYKWLIVGYFFAGGAGGAAQTLATAADFSGRGRYPNVVRAGRYIALAGAVVSPVLLIADLHTPARWYNMMRIFRKTSPMSIGAWTLAAFGTATGVVAAGQFLDDYRGGSPFGRAIARLFSVPAAVTGCMMSCYTGTLLSATSTPLWASVPKLLPALFGAASAANAASTISLALEMTEGTEEEHEALEEFEMIASGAELALVSATHQAWKEEGLDEPLQEEPLASTFRAGAIGLGIVVPLAIHGLQALSGKRNETASTVAALSTVAGGLLLRASVLFAGNKSAERPRDYFHFTRPPENGRLEGNGDRFDEPRPTALEPERRVMFGGRAS